LKGRIYVLRDERPQVTLNLHFQLVCCNWLAQNMLARRASKIDCSTLFIPIFVLGIFWLQVLAETPPRPKRCGEFCSFEHIEGYVGPLDTTKNLQDALNRLSYKREIVVAHHAQLDFVYQMVHRWQRFGYGHVLMVFPDHVLCHRLEGAFTKLGCGWYEDHNDMAWIVNQGGGCKGCTDKWLIHYTGARAVRMGYNVLVADADTMPLYDFYGMIHSPPYNNVTLFNQREGNFNVNGGMYYIQNAARDGPVAYVLYDHILKNVRWFEDVTALRRGIGLRGDDSSTGINDGFLCNDQFSLSDSVHGAITGRPQVFECVFWFHPRRPDWEKLHLTMYSKTGPEGGEGFGPYSTITVPVPEPLRRGAGGALQGQMVTAQLRIPHARGEWPSERGGYPFSLQLGPLAKHVMEIFREAGGDAAPFPDPWDTASAAAADAVPPEKFAYFPPWIANTHSLGPENNGNDGWYNDHLTGEVPAAISHLHAGLTSGDFTKIVHFAVEVPYGWDFDVALRVAPQTAPYLGTEVHGRVPPLLAIAPGVMHRGLTQGDFAAMMEGLMRLALVLNRAVVWPWVPCEAPFLRKAGATYDPVVSGHKIPWSDYIDTTAAIPNGPETISLKDGLRCLVASVDKLSCVRGGTRPGAPASAPRGLLPHEFDHWLATARKADTTHVDLDPTPKNTLQDILQRLGGSTAAGPPYPGAPLPPLELIPTDLSLLGTDPSLFSPMMPVMWLRGPVVVPKLPSPEHDRLYDKIKSMCCVLHEKPSRECIDRPPGAQMVPS
ncbi:hypothetical protein Vretimale_11418, partial [Volvox reticuliferus]